MMDKIFVVHLILFWLITLFNVLMPINDVTFSLQGKKLVDPKTGQIKYMIQFMNLSKVLNRTQEYIDSTNPQQRIYDLIYQNNVVNINAFNLSYSDPNDLERSGAPNANKELCSSQLEWILGELNTISNLSLRSGQRAHELAEFVDSLGRPEPNLYDGQVFWMGSFEKCSKLSLDQGRIKTRYCIGGLRFKTWPKEELTPIKTRIRIGVCIPESCDTRSYSWKKDVIDAIGMMNLGADLKENMEMDTLFCLPDNRSPLHTMPTSGWIFLLVISIWCIMIIGATILFYFNPESVILNAMSLRSSLKDLWTNRFKKLKDELGEIKVDLGPLNFFKSMLMMVLLVGHSSALANLFSRNIGLKIAGSTDTLSRGAMPALNLLDTFYSMFGLIFAYNFIKHLNSKQISNPIYWLASIIDIFIRMGPICILIYIYARSVGPYTGSGPWWDYGVQESSPRRICLQNPWWRIIPYTVAGACNICAYFVSLILQYSLIVPQITYLIYTFKSHLSRIIFTASILSASALWIGYEYYNQEFIDPYNITDYGMNSVTIFVLLRHAAPIRRLGAVALGALIGYFLRMYEIGNIKKLPKFLESRIACLIVLISHAMIMFSVPPLTYIVRELGIGPNSTQVAAAAFLATIVWPLLNAILIIQLSTTFSRSSTVRFMSHSFWYSLSKLNLCLLVIQSEVLVYMVTAFEDAPPRGTMSELAQFGIYTLPILLVAGLILHLFFEVPLIKLLRMALRSMIPSKKLNKDHQLQSIKPDL